MSPSDTRLPVVVLISGSGSNLQALIDAAANGAPFRICGVISNRPGVHGLKRADAAGVPNRVVDHTLFASRETFDAALAEAVEAFGPKLVVLAGFMRILTDDFANRYARRMINIHPSLLPAFQGLHTHRRALEEGVSEHGASVHFVTAELDGGPVIAQARTSVHADDTEVTLAARVLGLEHELLPVVVTWFARGELRMLGNQVWFKDSPLRDPIQC